jgi:hypothetical protein
VKKRYFLIILILTCRICNAQNFFPLPPGFNSGVRSLFYDSTSNILYAGGNFWKLADNNTSMIHISRWNGTAWDSLGAGLFGNVYSIVKYNGYIYAGGNFAIINNVGTFLTANIAYWDGTYWQRPPGGVYANNVVWSLSVNGNDLYVGGGFDTINGMQAQGIVHYDGTLWHSYPILDPVYPAFINAITIFNGELYAAGDFDGGAGLRDIVKFDGTNWVTVGGGLSGFSTFVSGMVVHQGELYIDGDFHVSTGDPGNCIAKWNGTTWSSVGAGLNFGGQLFALASFNNQIYVGGLFLTIAGVSSPYVARWDGTNWNSLGSIFNNGVLSFASHGNDLYIGGGFITIDNDTMRDITRYSPPLGIEQNNFSAEIPVSPNPFTSEISITFENQNINQATISIKNILGQTVFRQERKPSPLLRRRVGDEARS